MGFARDIAKRAKQASPQIAAASSLQRSAALRSMATCIERDASLILEANSLDIEQNHKRLSPALIDRLMLNSERVAALVDALYEMSNQPDVVGEIVGGHISPEGLQIMETRVPLGVVAVVYEARPNVTVDAAALCLRSGNAVILRGGSVAKNTNRTLVASLRQGLHEAGLPMDAIVLLDSTDHADTDELMQLRGLVDVLIPRGGARLINRCVEYARVPVIETGTGNCHVYIHESADIDRARAIVHNAKTSRPGVCNACESLLVDVSIASQVMPLLLKDLTAAGVECRLDYPLFALLKSEHPEFIAALEQGEKITPATAHDFETEYLDLVVSIKQVSGIDEAIEHINRYGTKHSECIVARDVRAIDRFMQEVDAAVVYSNASTRFSDGGCFGMGAEMGISTQKLHVRGPFAARALTSIKYVVRGDGQIRE